MADVQPQGCFGRFIAVLLGGGSGRRPAGSMPLVRQRVALVSRAEADFFRVLVRVVDDRGHVCPQVPVLALVDLPGSNQSNPGRQAWFNKLSRRTVDFVVADPATLRPIVAIELDDETHARPHRQQRDEEVDAALAAAGVRLVRVLVGRTYDTAELKAAIFELGAGSS